MQRPLLQKIERLSFASCLLSVLRKRATGFGVATILAVCIAGCVSPKQPRAQGQSSATEISSTDSATRPSTQPIIEGTFRRPTVDAALNDGIDFLIHSQQPDGSWGTGLETHGTETYNMVPGTHETYKSATTALAVMALREARDAGFNRKGIDEAHDCGLEYVLAHSDVRRDSGDLMLNTWSYIYSLQALVGEIRERPDDSRLISAAKVEVDRLSKSACYNGGWNYYDFGAQTQIPSSSGTSFGTAAGLVALHEAQQVGIESPKDLVRLAINRLEECLLPNQTYLYGADYRYSVSLPADRPRGAIGRTQPSNFALLLWQSKRVSLASSIVGLDLFFKEHAFLEMGRKHPTPHISWYQTSGYYYYYDHYYAARLVDQLDVQHKKIYDAQLLDCVMPHQEPDGSWWDFAMWDYHKPYGTSFAVMTLLRCRG